MGKMAARNLANMISTRIKLTVVALLGVMNIMAQDKQFTLEDLNFGGNNYHNMVPENRYSTWWGDECIRTDAEMCSVINKINGMESKLFTLDEINFITKGDSIHSLMNAEFPYSDKSLVLLSNSKTRMLIDWKAKKIEWMQSCKDESSEEWSKKSRCVAFVKDDNLFITNAEGKTTQLTTDGSRNIVYGKSVHRDEFGIYKGTFWSNDGNKLVFYRMDQSMVADYPQVDIDTRIATLVPDKYPMAGETSHKVTIGVYNLKNGKTTYLKAGDPTDRYFTNVTWSPDDKKIYLIELNRDQTDEELVCYDAVTGEKISTLYREHDDKYVHPVNPITFLPWDQSKFILQSEKDGYKHLYLFNTKGEQIKQLTSGKWIVMDLLGFNIKKRSAIILSTERSPLQNNLYSVDIKSGKRTLLDNGNGVHCTGEDAGGHHGINMSEDGEYIWDRFSDPNIARKINIINTSDAKNENYFTAKDPWCGYKVPEISCGKLKAADGTTDLYYRMVKPVDFDPHKKYPTIVYVYGGPGLRNVEARYHYMARGWEIYMAQKGYLLFILDNRGSCDRGKAFEQATFRHLGVEEMKDQIKGVEFLKSLAYVDTTRLGIHGWSFGGYMTISLMTTYPDVFKVGVAGGPVIDWKYYEVMYGERYMDTPQSNPEGYKETSLINKAKNLKGRLQIIIGYNDPVVVPQHTLSFLEACIQAGTQPDFFVYPGEPHNMRGHKSVHLHERISRYFDDYLK